MIVEKPTYYAIIPANVRYDENLQMGARLLYGEITALSNVSGQCWASDQYFVDLYKVSKRTIQSWLKSLDGSGYIERVVTYKENSKEIDKRYISICSVNSNIDVVKKTALPYGNKLHCPSEINCVDNSTSINTTSSNSNTYVGKSRFTPPSLEQVEDYCKERNNGIDPQSFIDFYSSKGWYVGKNKMKDWKASIRTWERRNGNKPKSVKKEKTSFSDLI